MHGDGCPLNELFSVSLDIEPKDCTPSDFAVFFGPTPTTETVDATGVDQFVISSRNARPLFGFQLGVEIEATEQGAVFRFTDGLGAEGKRLVEVRGLRSQRRELPGGARRERRVEVRRREKLADDRDKREVRIMLRAEKKSNSLEK